MSGFIKAENFDGKRQFIEKFDGLNFLQSLMTDEVASTSVKLYKKVLICACDLIVNDDTIFKEQPFMVREFFARSEQIYGMLIKAVSHERAQIEDVKMFDVRLWTLRILFRLHQHKAEEIG